LSALPRDGIVNVPVRRVTRMLDASDLTCCRRRSERKAQAEVVLVGELRGRDARAEIARRILPAADQLIDQAGRERRAQGDGAGRAVRKIVSDVRQTGEIRVAVILDVRNAIDFLPIVDAPQSMRAAQVE